MISAVAEMYGIHPQTLRLYEREGLLKPSRTDGNTRLYTEEDLERLEFILNLARDLGVHEHVTFLGKQDHVERLIPLEQAVYKMTGGPAQALNDIVRGQYDSGTVLGRAVRAYRQEPDVALYSSTETFIACKLTIDNWRWAGVPFYLRTGKYLKRRMTEIAIRFHQAPYTLFRGTNVARMNPNWIILRIQPNEGIALEFAAKRPGPTVKLSSVSMDFSYKSYFKVEPNTGYETLLFDCMIGDATLFQRADNIEAGWQAVQPILDAWADNQPRDFPNYAAGGSGPAAANELLVRDGRAWRPLD